MQSRRTDERLVVNPTQTPDYASRAQRINKMRYTKTKKRSVQKWQTNLNRVTFGNTLPKSFDIVNALQIMSMGIKSGHTNQYEFSNDNIERIQI